MTKDSGEIRKLITSRFTSLSRELLKVTPQNKTKTKYLNQIEDECFAFRNFISTEVNHLGASISRCRTLIETCLKIYLSSLGGKVCETFIENETTLKRHLNDSDDDVLHQYIKTIRLSSNKKIHYRKDSTNEEDDESIALLFLALHVLEYFFRAMVGLVVSPELKPTPKSEVKKEFILFDERESHSGVCMENAIGIPCHRNCKEHCDKIMVHKSFTTIGTIGCLFGSECKKNKKILKMPSGKEVSICPYLHGDKFDDVKSKIGKNWDAYSKGQIAYADIFESTGSKDELLVSKTNLVCSQRCKFLPCMVNACGVTCTRRCIEHSDKITVYHAYTRIGLDACEFGSTCNKSGKIVVMRDGRICDQCPFLHGTYTDAIKKRLALGWEKYSQGLITYEQIFTDEEL